LKIANDRDDPAIDDASIGSIVSSFTREMSLPLLP